MSLRNIIKTICLVFVLAMFASCTSHKNLIYFQTDDLNDVEPLTQYYKYPDGGTNDSPEYKIQAHDVLYVQITSSVDEEASRLFSNSGTGYNAQFESSLFLYSYEVNEEGDILLPTIGLVHVADMTIEQAQLAIKERAEEYSNDIVVVCRLVSFKIKVTGEVARPGIYTFYQPSVDVFDALVSAGDLTFDANRSKVRVIRKTNTEDIVYTLDVRKTSVMRDSGYYLRPGDIVYVEPNKVRKSLTGFDRSAATTYYIFSILSSMVSIVTLLIALKK